VTLTAAEVELLRRENRVDLATLAQVPNLVDLLRPGATTDQGSGTVWWLMSSTDDETYPILVLGVRGDVGFLHWHAGPHEMYAPAGVEYHDGGQTYFHGSYNHDATNGEEIPVHHVIAAAAQFAATGRRPTCLQWISGDDVPDHRTPLDQLPESDFVEAYRTIFGDDPGGE
jgi:hypothetical protein